ncbi:MAG: hypothetical protein AABX26_02935 [Nanoarchaeota archaeon]
MNQITKNVEKFYESINHTPNHRYKSWEHCYNFFKYVKDKELSEKELDLAQLHLAFYLASWGMYRGSSFILQKDYTIFKGIVEEILLKKYSLLWSIEENLDKKEQLSSLFIILYDKIENKLKIDRSSVKNHPDFEGIDKAYLKDREEISHTLITKILLGTMGCIPAYDRFFKEGLEIENIQKKFNSKKSFIQMIDFYIKNKEELDKLKEKIKGYPLMKILDMYFWVAGYEKLSVAKKK